MVRFKYGGKCPGQPLLNEPELMCPSIVVAAVTEKLVTFAQAREATS